LSVNETELFSDLFHPVLVQKFTGR